MDGKKLTIGAVAPRAGIRAKVIRFYEAAGIVAPPPRGANGYRLYPPDTIGVLRFVKQAQGLGLTLAEIREIVAIRDGGRPPCRHVYRLLEDKAADLDRKLADLMRLRRRLRLSLGAWRTQSAGPATVCPHIEAPPAARNRGARPRGR